MVVFLIDADNLNSPAWVDEAITIIESTEGPIAVRRAYGSAENLKGLAEPLRDRAIRPYLNVYLTKNTTDMALAVDAMELACQLPALRTLAIGSGDADFVPLVLRLRERGIKVLCVTPPGKMAPEAVQAYDGVLHVGGQVAAKKAAPPKTPAPAPKASPAPAAKKAAAKKAPASKKAAAKAAEPGAITPADQVTVAMLLDAIPQLRSGQPVHISDAAKALHDQKLLGKSASSVKLFKRFPKTFELKPEPQPKQVRLIADSE